MWETIASIGSSIWDALPSWGGNTSNTAAGIAAGSGSSSVWDNISDWFGGGSLISDVLSSQGFWSGIGAIGSNLFGQARDEAAREWEKEKFENLLAWQKEELAQRLAAEQAMNAARVGATIKAAEIAADAANKRAKLAALMDASARRIDANFTGTGQQLNVIRNMLESYGGRRYR